MSFAWTERYRLPLAMVVLATALSLAGCKSPYIAAVITNQSSTPVTLIEVDYPSASFGVDALAPGASFPYRFKIQGDGPVKVSWTDGSRRTHSATGPKLEQGQQGPLQILITSRGVQWTSHLTP